MIAQVHGERDELLLARFRVEVLHELAIELDHLGLEVRDDLQVGIAGAQVVDDQVRGGAAAHLAKDARAEVEVRDGRGLGDFEVNVVVVREDRIVRADEPPLFELVRVEVDEERLAAAERDRDLADHSPESARRP